GATVIHAHCYVTGLSIDCSDHATSIAIEAVFRSRITDISNRLADDLWNIDPNRGGDFSRNNYQSGSQQRLTSDAALRIIPHYRIKHAVGNLIGNLVGMPFGDRLRRKQTFV